MTQTEANERTGTKKFRTNGSVKKNLVPEINEKMAEWPGGQAHLRVTRSNPDSAKYLR